MLAVVVSESTVRTVGRRVSSAISRAGKWAMRPQTAMASVFLVMVGTSVLFIRARPIHTPTSASVTVIEQGSPAPVAVAPIVRERLDADYVGVASPSGHDTRQPGGSAALNIPTRRDISPAASGKPGGSPIPIAGDNAVRTQDDGAPFDDAQRAYQARRFDDAARAFDALAPRSSNAELWAARSVRESKGCRAAATRFERVIQRAGQTPAGWDARLEGALCYRAIGDVAAARARLLTLLEVDSHKDRARVELERLEPSHE
jgi:TolA-binding protein